MVFHFNEKIAIMAVGKSGVGKSTIGNFLLTGKPMLDDGSGFHTSVGVESCTQDVEWKASKNCKYGDVPGIPDTKPANTRKFYDIIAQEARVPLHAILFVFKKDRIDESVYETARLLFREFQENSTVPKVLIINDHTNYGFGAPPPGDAELEKQAMKIEEVTKMKFEAIFYINTSNMGERLQDLLKQISSFKKSASPHIRTFEQLKAWEDGLRNKITMEADIRKSRQRSIDTLEDELFKLQLTVVATAAAAGLATLGSFFTFGTTLGIATPAAAAATAAVAAIEIKKLQLRRAKESISREALDKATRELESALQSFKDLSKALQI